MDARRGLDRQQAAIDRLPRQARASVQGRQGHPCGRGGGGDGGRASASASAGPCVRPGVVGDGLCQCLEGAAAGHGFGCPVHCSRAVAAEALPIRDRRHAVRGSRSAAATPPKGPLPAGGARPRRGPREPATLPGIADRAQNRTCPRPAGLRRRPLSGPWPARSAAYAVRRARRTAPSASSPACPAPPAAGRRRNGAGTSPAAPAIAWPSARPKTRPLRPAAPHRPASPRAAAHGPCGTHTGPSRRLSSRHAPRTMSTPQSSVSRIATPPYWSKQQA